MHSEETTQPDLLTPEYELVRASTGQRFANYIIDVIFFYVLFIVLGVVIAFTSPSMLEEVDNNSVGINLIDRLISLVLYALYMGLMEGLTKGRSLGKLITGTKAVNMDGSKISFATAFARGFSRAVPFCVFSAFGTPCNPWQDKWTNTMVIDIKKSVVLA
ncbi:RDD family protein [Foetidibacter luteolus]|uniref:RDD family protein n=1 Tax=Foetidibacter luteolus TaxID=2608880 RepID=UPI00129B91CC|nr:RDD family protein [Foetidibacter luteolus]